LKAPGLSLSSENLVSKVAFEFNLYRYGEAVAAAGARAAAAEAHTRAAEVGLCELRIQLTHSLKAPGFNPLDL
jgi:hypothetical protein